MGCQIFLLCLLSLPYLSKAQSMRVGVFTAYKLQLIEAAYHNGSFLIVADGQSFGAILPNEYVSLRKTSDAKVELKHGVKLLGRFREVQLKPTKTNFALRWRAMQPSLKERRYQGAFNIKVKNGHLLIINEVDMDTYLMGVVESEGGGGKPLEYYKAQAVISRTYAIKHQNKHAKEGYHLCDQVHCQAYHNMLRFTDDIATAVNATSGSYLVQKQNGELVDGYFHANCGGQTSQVSYVWNNDIPYLIPFKDPFCTHTPQATWEKRIPKLEWQKFLVNKYHYPIHDPIYGSVIFNFEQNERKAFYISPHLGVPLRDIRAHFNLRSTFFSCYPDGNDVVLKGRGYGHGIGMCQEGAMEMARQGFHFEQILNYYFRGVKVENDLYHLHFRHPNLQPFE